MTWSVPGYVAERMLGFGATGEVWSGRDEATGEAVALKRLRAGSDPAERERLRREAVVLAAFRHPHVVRLRGVLGTGEGLVLVLDLATEGSLTGLLAARGRLGAEEAVAILAPVAEALAAAHHAGIVHGDVAPGNVLLAAGGCPLLADLGTARLTGDSDPAVYGTAGYVDPAVRAGELPTPASDVYALGALAVHAVTGRPVAEADDVEADGGGDEHRRGRGRRDRAGRGRRESSGRRAGRRAGSGTDGRAHGGGVGPDLGEVPAALAEVLRRATAAEPSFRPDAGELAQLLRGALPLVDDPAITRRVRRARTGGAGDVDEPDPGAGGSGRLAERLGRSPWRVERAPRGGRAGWRLGCGGLWPSRRPGRRAAPVARRRLGGQRSSIRSRVGSGVGVGSRSGSGSGSVAGSRWVAGARGGVGSHAATWPAGARAALLAVVLCAAVGGGMAWSAVDRDKGGAAAVQAAARTGPPSVVAAPTAPSPADAVVDWPRVLDGLDARRAAAFARADAEALHAIYTPDGPARRIDAAAVSVLVAAGARAVGVRHEVRSVRVEPRPPGTKVGAGGGAVSLLVTDRMPAYRVLGPGGRTLRAVPARGERTVRLHVHRTPAGWRIDAVQPVVTGAPAGRAGDDRVSDPSPSAASVPASGG